MGEVGGRESGRDWTSTFLVGTGLRNRRRLSRTGRTPTKSEKGQVPSLSVTRVQSGYGRGMETRGQIKDKETGRI